MTSPTSFNIKNMKGIVKNTRLLFEYYEKNAGIPVQYWGQIRSWKEGCQQMAETIFESMFFHGDRYVQECLWFRLKFLWDREHFLEDDSIKTLESFYYHTQREVVKRLQEITDNLKLS